MDDQQTCGKGLAAHASVPMAMGRVADAVAEILELHRETLILADAKARLEDAAYDDLARRHRAVARELQANAERMASHRDLPMGRHDEAALNDPRHLAAFERLVHRERELVTLLETRLAEEGAMLRQAHRDARPEDSGSP
jgi:hypothetical protein